MKEHSSPLKVFLTANDVFFGESIHSSDFSMNWRKDEFDKILYVLRGETTLHLEKCEPIVAQAGTFLLIPYNYFHRLQDSKNSTILLLCLGRKWIQQEKDAKLLWDQLKEKKGYFLRPLPSTRNRIEKLWRKCLFEQNSLAVGVSEILKASILILLVELLREINFSKSRKSMNRIAMLWDEVKKDYYETWDVQIAADRCQLSRRQFTDLFKKRFSKTFIELLTLYRLNEFKKMCLIEHRSISEAVFACGFEDLSHFYRLFKRYFHLSPGIWLEQNRPKRK